MRTIHRYDPAKFMIVFLNMSDWDYSSAKLRPDILEWLVEMAPTTKVNMSGFGVTLTFPDEQAFMLFKLGFSETFGDIMV